MGSNASRNRAAHAAITPIAAGVIGVAWNTEMGNQFLRFITLD